MTRVFHSFILALAALALLIQPAHAATAEEQALYQQRLDAQRERQQQVNARSREINEATRDFRSLTQELKTEYREQLRGLDTEFELRKVDIKAAHDARLTTVESEYQARIMDAYMGTGGESAAQTPEQLGEATRAHAEKVFGLKKRYAEELHAEIIAREKRKDELLTEMDQKALDEARSLGLMNHIAPVLATPIGGELTPQEQKWNDREKKAAVKLEERNRKTTSEFRNGAKLRQWEIDNLNEDFELTWQEKAEIHALDAEQTIVNSMMTGYGQGGQVDSQQAMAKIRELGQKQQKIKIEYRKQRDKNRIERREERKKILSE